MDSTVRVSFNRGWVDASLELLDEQGKVLAAADDTLGLDPVLEHRFTQDGRYTVRVQSLAYQGSIGSVYRLTLGDVPVPASVFPAGGQRGVGARRAPREDGVAAHRERAEARNFAGAGGAARARGHGSAR